MSPYEQFCAVVIGVIVIGVIAGHFVECRRNRPIDVFECQRRERKADVGHAARKTR